MAESDIERIMSSVRSHARSGSVGSYFLELQRAVQMGANLSQDTLDALEDQLADAASLKLYELALNGNKNAFDRLWEEAVEYRLLPGDELRQLASLAEEKAPPPILATGVSLPIDAYKRLTNDLNLDASQGSVEHFYTRLKDAEKFGISPPKELSALEQKLYSNAIGNETQKLKRLIQGISAERSSGRPPATKDFYTRSREIDSAERRLVEVSEKSKQSPAIRVDHALEEEINSARATLFALYNIKSFSAEQVRSYIKGICELYGVWPNSFVSSTETGYELRGQPKGVMSTEFNEQLQGVCVTSDYHKGTFLFVKRGNVFMSTPEVKDLEAILAAKASAVVAEIAPAPVSRDYDGYHGDYIREIGREVLLGITAPILVSYQKRDSTSTGGWGGGSQGTEENLVLEHPAGFSIEFSSFYAALAGIDKEYKGKIGGSCTAEIAFTSKTPAALEYVRRLFVSAGKSGLSVGHATYVPPQKVSLVIADSPLVEAVIGEGRNAAESFHGVSPAEFPTSLDDLTYGRNIDLESLLHIPRLNLTFDLDSVPHEGQLALALKTPKGTFDLSKGTLYVVKTEFYSSGLRSVSGTMNVPTVSPSG